MDSSQNAAELMRNCELQILDHVLSICRAQNIRYFILGGTMLGAVRHNGFIPWDDDIDLGIPRPDYDRLSEILKRDNNENFKLVHYSDPDNDCRRFFIQLESTSVKLRMFGQNEGRVRGVWVDIFPLDGMPNNALLRKIVGFRMMVLRGRAQLSQFDKIVNVRKASRPFHERIIIFAGDKLKIGRHTDTVAIYRKMERILRRYYFDNSEYAANIFGAYKLKETVPSAWFGEGALYSFEGRKLCGPVDYDNYLRQLYGNYMELPPEDQRNWHQVELIGSKDTDDTSTGSAS